MDRIPTEQYGSRILKALYTALHVQTRTYKHDFLPSIAPVTLEKNYKMNDVICIENRFIATTSIIDNLHLECDLGELYPVLRIYVLHERLVSGVKKSGF